MALEGISSPTSVRTETDEANDESFPASDPPATNGDGAHDPGAEPSAGARARAACRSPTASRSRRR